MVKIEDAFQEDNFQIILLQLLTAHGKTFGD